MKIKRMFYVLVLLAIAVAPFFFPTPAEAGDPDIPYVHTYDDSKFTLYTGKYSIVGYSIELCNGTKIPLWANPGPQETVSGDIGSTIKSILALFNSPGDEIINHCSGYCGCPAKQKKVSTCGGFSIPSRVPRSPATRVSFKGPGNITHANIYFKKLGYSLPLWLYKYDWGSGKWQAYLNTLSLPLGKHHGRVTTYVDGLKGGGCATGGFKIVDE